MNGAGTLDVEEMVLGFIAGLVIFLYGIKLLSEEHKAVAGERMRRLLARFTVNRVAGVATGTVATAVLDSSSATVDHGRRADPRRAAEPLADARGGHGGQHRDDLFALDAIKYGPLLLPPGLLLHWLGRSASWRHVGGASSAWAWSSTP